MPRITVYGIGNRVTLEVPVGTRLLDALRDGGMEIPAPCGGQGTCGKCRVQLGDGRYVMACLYRVEEDLEVTVPGPLESEILTRQYTYSREVPIAPGEVAMKAASSHGLAMQAASPHGLAIDLGTTTLVLYFTDLVTGSVKEIRSLMNPQSAYGADVITRIQYCSEQEEGTVRLQGLVVDAVNRQVAEFLESNELGQQDLVKVTVSGNTTMLHLFLGADPRSLALVPFTPVFTDEQTRRGGELGLACREDAWVQVLPSLTAYVGADIVAGLASLDPPREHRTYLFVDLGTNGEMALVTPSGTYCCATAAGPAFEGANITHGMGAFRGAIRSFDADEGYRTIGGVPPAGICGSGLFDLVAWLVSEGIAGSDGYMEEDYIVEEAGRSGREGDVLLTPGDIREVQLAKSAVRSGINIMMRRAGLEAEQIDALYLAGGFGNYLRVESAVALGMIPAALEEKVIPVGNTSGTGALLALKSVPFASDINRLRERMTYIELSEDGDFPMEFAMNMNF